MPIFPFIMQIGKMAKNWRTPDAQPSLPPYAPHPFIGRSGILDKKMLYLATVRTATQEIPGRKRFA